MILKKSKSILDFLFFFGFILVFVTFLITIITLKNECIFLQSEIYHLNNIKATHINRLKVISGNIKNLSRRDRIEKIAFEKFNLYKPVPESLIVYMWDNK